MEHTPSSVPSNGDTLPHEDIPDLSALHPNSARLVAGLQEGGPPIDEAALLAYCVDALDETSRKAITARIVTWKAWYRAYWDLRAELSQWERERSQWEPEVDQLQRAVNESRSGHQALWQHAADPGMQDGDSHAGEEGQNDA